MIALSRALPDLDAIGLCHSVPGTAALLRTNINVQELTVAAVLEGKREHVYHAAMLDPHTAELTLDEIHNLVDDMIAAHGDYIPANLRS